MAETQQDSLMPIIDSRRLVQGSLPSGPPGTYLEDSSEPLMPIIDSRRLVQGSLPSGPPGTYLEDSSEPRPIEAMLAKPMMFAAYPLRH